MVLCSLDEAYGNSSFNILNNSTPNYEDKTNNYSNNHKFSRTSKPLQNHNGSMNREKKSKSILLNNEITKQKSEACYTPFEEDNEENIYESYEPSNNKPLNKENNNYYKKTKDKKLNKNIINNNNNYNNNYNNNNNNNYNNNNNNNNNYNNNNNNNNYKDEKDEKDDEEEENEEDDEYIENENRENFNVLKNNNLNKIKGYSEESNSDDEENINEENIHNNNNEDYEDNLEEDIDYKEMKATKKDEKDINEENDNDDDNLEVNDTSQNKNYNNAYNEGLINIDIKNLSKKISDFMNIIDKNLQSNIHGIKDIVLFIFIGIFIIFIMDLIFRIGQKLSK
jgi:hypothetical protein